MTKIGFIGAGNMACAIISGISRAKQNISISAYDLQRDKLELLAEKYGVIPAASLKEASSSDCLFLAIKPQNFAEVLTELREVDTSSAVLVSIAAGVTSEYISQMLGYPAKVICVMPNTPLMLGVGASALSKSACVSEEEFAFVREIFNLSGVTEVIPSDKMNEVIPINGSSPAFIYQFARCFIDYGVSVGLDEKTCLSLFSQTLIGSARMMTESGYTIDELIAMVSSKGGTTIAGLEGLRENGLNAAVKAACEKCVERAYELTK